MSKPNIEHCYNCGHPIHFQMETFQRILYEHDDSIIKKDMIICECGCKRALPVIK